MPAETHVCKSVAPTCPAFFRVPGSSNPFESPRAVLADYNGGKLPSGLAVKEGSTRVQVDSEA
jgi:hypothetical protein